MRNEKFLRDFDWNLLMMFLVIAEESSITKAAARLHRAQPSISNALKRLEEAIGHRLVERRRGRFALTNQGRLLREQALQVLHSIEGIGDLVASERGLSGEISFQIASHFECPALDTTLGAFHQEHPRIAFYIETVPSERIVSHIESGQIKIGFCVLSTLPPALECYEVWQSEMGFYCGRSHPLFGRRDITIADLDKLNYISFESDLLSAGLNAVALLGIGKRFRMRRVAVSPNDEEVLRLIETGIGFGPLFTAMARPYVDQGRLWRLPPYENPPRVTNYLVTNPATRLTVPEARFVDALRERIQPPPSGAARPARGAKARRRPPF